MNKKKSGTKGGTKARSKWPLVAAVVVVIALTALAFFLPLRDWTDVFEDKIESMDLAAGLLTFGIVYVVATLLLVPGWIFPLAAGAIFGLGWGAVVTVASIAASSAAAFLISRYVLRGPMERLARRHRLFKAFDQAVGKEGWRIVALLRLSPILSFGTKSYFFGLTCVELVGYMVGTLVGTLPGVALKVWLGAAGRDVVSRGGPTQWAMLGLGIAATIAVSVVLTRMTRTRLKLAR
jgi:uncharacterized membrane protein YdjX (TVP38/TMEM64 family)